MQLQELGSGLDSWPSPPFRYRDSLRPHQRTAHQGRLVSQRMPSQRSFRHSLCHALTTDLLQEWSSRDESFGKDPPNATVSVFSKDASLAKDAVVVLTSPALDGDKLTFTVKVLEGDLAGADGPAAVFIDIIGPPFTPLSFAGAARRTAARAAFYSAAAHPYPYQYPSLFLSAARGLPGLRLLPLSALLLVKILKSEMT